MTVTEGKVQFPVAAGPAALARLGHASHESPAARAGPCLRPGAATEAGTPRSGRYSLELLHRVETSEGAFSRPGTDSELVGLFGIECSGYTSDRISNPSRRCRPSVLDADPTYRQIFGGGPGAGCFGTTCRAVPAEALAVTGSPPRRQAEAPRP